MTKTPGASRISRRAGTENGTCARRREVGCQAPVTRPFLTARWENLILLNYRCQEELLRPLVPAGTELDAWQGEYLVSLVGFQFLDTRVRGVAIPRHRSFEEVNLRFYVRRVVGSEVRRGVVFIRELVPRRLIAAVARMVYHEPYLSLPMSHDVDLKTTTGGSVRYAWGKNASRHSLAGSAAGPAFRLAPGSEAEFVTEHYWGYNRQRAGGTLEYRVEHFPWAVWECVEAKYTSPRDSFLYGPFAEVLSGQPVSAFIAVGGEVSVFPGLRLPATLR